MVSGFWSVFIFTTITLIYLCASGNGPDKDIADARHAVEMKEYNRALKLYNKAIRMNDDDYLLYYERGIVNLKLDNIYGALRDFDNAIDLKQDYVKAMTKKAEIYESMEDYHAAMAEYKRILKFYPYNQRAANMIFNLQELIDKTVILDSLIQNGFYRNASDMISELLEISPLSVKLNKYAHEMSEKLGKKFDSLYLTVLEKQMEYWGELLDLAKLWYEKGFAVYALRTVKRCLSLYPDEKECMVYFKEIKKQVKSIVSAEEHFFKASYGKCIAEASDVLDIEKNNKAIIYDMHRILCACYSNDEKNAEAIDYCSSALNVYQDPTNYCDRGEAYLRIHWFRYALADFEAALELKDNSERAKVGIQKVSELRSKVYKEFFKVDALPTILILLPFAYYNWVVYMKNKESVKGYKKIISELDNLL